MGAPAGAWRLVSGQRLARRAWEGEAVLFNDVTGATHLLAGVALWVLERLQAAPADAPALARALNAALDGEAEADVEADVEPDVEPDLEPIHPSELDALLQDLCKMQLVEPC